MINPEVLINNEHNSVTEMPVLHAQWKVFLSSKEAESTASCQHESLISWPHMPLEIWRLIIAEAKDFSNFQEAF